MAYNQWRIVEKISTETNKTALIEWLINSYFIERQNAEYITKLRLPQGYASVSLAAAEKIIPFLKQNLTYDKACEQAGINHSEFHTGEIYAQGDLPYYGQLLQRYALGGDREMDASEYPQDYYGKINNPTVHIALNQLRIIVNELAKYYGHGPEQIHIELARELPLSANKYAELTRNITQGRKDNERINTELEKLGVTQNYQNRMKFKLWEDLAKEPDKRCCPFTGKIISLDDLFRVDYEIEHLLPFSLSFDDSRANKVISHRDANRLKRNQSPYEAFAHNPSGYNWNEIIARVENLPTSKQWRFHPDAWEKWQGQNGDILARMLNDTRYMAKVARQYLEYACDKRQVVSITGRLTAMLRHQWGLDTLIGENEQKNRTDHRHHAVDAFVVACTSRKTLMEVSRAARRNNFYNKLLNKLQAPYNGFTRADIQNRIDSVVISYKTDHGTPRTGSTAGALHQETYYGRIGDSPKKGYGLYALRKPLIEVEAKADKIDLIASTAIRDDLLQQLNQQPAKKQWLEFLHNYAKKNNIRRVRLHFEKKDANMIPIADKNGQPYRYVIGGNNFCAEIWCTDKHKKAYQWQMEIISMFDIHQPDFKPLWRQENPTAWRVMRLQINDMVAYEKDGQTKIRRVKKINSSGLIYLRNHLIAKEQQDKQSWAASAGQLQIKNARKLYVDPLGGIKDPKHARKAQKIPKLD